MKGLLSPKSIAIVGVSREPKKIGHALASNVKKTFKGKLYFVNPFAKKILGVKCYKSVLDVPGKVDLGIIVIPADKVPGVVKECVDKGIKNIIIISAGFGEAGNKKDEEEILKIIKGKARVLGPNCFGIVNTHDNIDTTFALVSPLKGSVAFVSQGGGVLAAVAFYSIMYNFGFSYFISLGNMLDLDFVDFIEYFDKDPRTTAIVMYIERLNDGGKFMEVAKKCKKPIIVLKGGRSEAGKRAALSHTGSLAGSYEIYEAAFKQCGVTLIETITEAFDKAKYYQEVKGNRIVIISNAGAQATLSTDYCEKYGLEVVKLPEDLKFEKLPRAWSHNNPMDIIGDADAERFSYVFDELCKRKDFFDCALVIVGQQKTIDIQATAKKILQFKRKLKKPIVVCWMTDADKSVLEKERIPCFFDAYRAIKTFVLKK
ncbi:MAG: CoA-binding protein [Nanoarchaeota archaeon]|nr:CoA-binding protein [Nanoarchaeota archaeon]